MDKSRFLSSFLPNLSEALKQDHDKKIDFPDSDLQTIALLKSIDASLKKIIALIRAGGLN